VELSEADRLGAGITQPLEQPPLLRVIDHHRFGPAFLAPLTVGIARTARGAKLAELDYERITGIRPKQSEIGAAPTKRDYLLWIGRMTAEKGPDRAIAAARAAGVPLVLAGVIQPGQEAFFEREVAPHEDGDRVRFVGEVGGAVKRSLFADARALLMPIRWEEPFGIHPLLARVVGILCPYRSEPTTLRVLTKPITKLGEHGERWPDWSQRAHPRRLTHLGAPRGLGSRGGTRRFGARRLVREAVVDRLDAPRDLELVGLGRVHLGQLAELGEQEAESGIEV